MKNDRHYDITDVCNMLETTSRTLRFYEEKGIIQSTTVGNSSRRQYSKEQIAHIKNVLVLRTLGLSLKAIRALQQNNADLKTAVLSKRAEIYASIDRRICEINLLNEALSEIESGKNIFDKDWHKNHLVTSAEKRIVDICSAAIVSGNTDELYEYLSPRMIQYMPMDAFEVIRKDALEPLGKFVSFEGTEADTGFPNKIYRFVRYSGMGLKITFVFYGQKIDGLWLSYYETESR